jgi:hypothetical protein
VAGVMSVDADTVPATITSVDFDNPTSPELWTIPGEKTGVIHGSFLSGGTPVIVNADAFGITKVTAAPSGATDRELPFTVTLSKAIDSGQKLKLQVTKTNKQNRKISSMIFELPVQYLLTSPTITDVASDGSKLTISGSNFFSDSNHQLSVTLVPSRQGVSPVEAKEFSSGPTSKKLEIDLTKLGLAPSCWIPSVNVGVLRSLPAASFAIPPKPKITNAKANQDRVTVEGSDFIDLKPCNCPLEVFYVQDSQGATPTRAENVTIDSETKLSFKAPTPSTAKWKVVLKLKGAEVATAAIQ